MITDCQIIWYKKEVRNWTRFSLNCNCKLNVHMSECSPQGYGSKKHVFFFLWSYLIFSRAPSEPRPPWCPLKNIWAWHPWIVLIPNGCVCVFVCTWKQQASSGPYWWETYNWTQIPTWISPEKNEAFGRITGQWTKTAQWLF